MLKIVLEAAPGAFDFLPLLLVLLGAAGALVIAVVSVRFLRNRDK